jgi:hypothetical protein
MDSKTALVTSVEQLLEATRNEQVEQIIVRGEISQVPVLRLSPGQRLVGEGDGTALLFRPEVDGLQITTDNEVRDLHLQVSRERRALFTDTSVQTLGRLLLAHLSVVGQVQILLRDQLRGGHVSVSGLDILAADVRSAPDRPHGYGVSVQQGALTVWNQQPATQGVLTADLVGISLGREHAPVNGSGVFVGGAGVVETSLKVSRLETERIFVDGKIPEGTADLISGGVFVVYGAHVDDVINRGAVVTYGPNDMVLDNWGEVDRWIAEGTVTSYGPSAIGFVNFGTTRSFHALQPIETFGRGARGFNAYDGLIDTAEFERIETHADAGVGIQISRPVTHLIVHGGITTHGGVGESLVKGVIKQLPAYGLSVQPGAIVGEVLIDRGGIVTEGDQVVSVQMQGEIGSLQVQDSIRASGQRSDAMQVEGGSVGLQSLVLRATHGVALRLKEAHLSSLQGVQAHGEVGDMVVEADSWVQTGASSPEELRSRSGNVFTISSPDALHLQKEPSSEEKRNRRERRGVS